MFTQMSNSSQKMILIKLSAIGVYSNKLKRGLVHCIQWLDTQEKPNSGSLLSVAWSLDGTQIAGVGGNGTIIFGQLVHR
jgi:hypothetical protein